LEYGQFGGDVVHGVGSVIQPIVKLFLRLTVVAMVASRRVAVVVIVVAAVRRRMRAK
jgi:hypothetical protein